MNKPDRLMLPASAAPANLHLMPTSIAALQRLTRIQIENGSIIGNKTQLLELAIEAGQTEAKLIKNSLAQITLESNEHLQSVAKAYTLLTCELETLLNLLKNELIELKSS